MGGIGDAQLAALSQRRQTSVIGHAYNVRVGHGAQQIAQQIAHQIVEFHVGDEMRGLLVAQRAPKHARKTEQGMAAAGQAVRLGVGADQLTLHAEGSGLQRDKVDVLEGRAIHSLAKHDC